jgi:hypothetical protein
MKILSEAVTTAELAAKPTLSVPLLHYILYSSLIPDKTKRKFDIAGTHQKKLT